MMSEATENNGSAHRFRDNDNIGDSLEMKIALAFDSDYALPASVTLRSIAENVQGPIMLYILDCGLTSGDKKRLEASLSIRSDITLRFMDLPPNSLASNLGAAWGRIDMMKCLPVDRILYLDADLLVRKDLRELWNTDLRGYPLAAAPDVWCTQRSQSLSRGHYFNCGVLLIDTASAPSKFAELEARCHEMKDSLLHEQDPLNIHFRDEWIPLSLTWNAQGLGTYEKRANKKIRSDDMKDPAIVHFTGPVHPPLEDVVNYHIQPYTAKPWGYTGAPGHPYEQEWWEMLEKTAWKGWKEMDDYKDMCQRTRAKALDIAKEEFNRRVEATRLR